MERERERERGRAISSNQASPFKGRKREYSVFIHNLPRSLDCYGLEGIFQKAGSISDVYIPVHYGTKSPRGFGFVRFFKVQDARRSIRMFNGGRIRGLKIKVSMAKPKVQGQKPREDHWISTVPRVQIRKAWRRKADEVKSTENSNSQGSPKIQAIVTGQINEDFEVWLERSLVCTSVEPRDLATLGSALLEGLGLNFKLSALSCFQFLLTFPTKDSLEEALQYHNELQQWFTDIKRWGMEDCCDSRRVWVEILGVPPHGWTWENFKKIAELWGKFVCLGRSSTKTDSFEVMKVLIATKVLRRIEAEIVLHLGYGGYRVFIKEVGTISQVSNLVHKSSMDTNEELQTSNCGIPGFEDIDDNISNQEDEEQRVVPVQNFSKNSAEKETASNNGRSKHATSLVRTPTVSFSQNGYSEELLKVDQHLRKVVYVSEHEEPVQDEESLPPPGFDFELDKNIDSKDPNLEKSHSSLHSFEQLGVAEESIDNQNNILRNSVIDTNSCKLRPNHNQQGVPQDRRETKAQSKSNSENTSSDSESLRELALESLKFGELLGVRVTGSMEAAITRIVSPLKKMKKQNKKSKKTTKA